MRIDKKLVWSGLYFSCGRKKIFSESYIFKKKGKVQTLIRPTIKSLFLSKTRLNLVKKS